MLGHGAAAGQAFLALEWIDFGSASSRSESLLGEGLAAQHRVTGAQFGWHRGNTIGSTPQRNDPDRDWIRFFVEHRLRYQLDLAARNGHAGRLAERGACCASEQRFFDSYRPVLSLLHGDLWGGNWSADASGRPVIFDPAVYSATARPISR